jgi:succinate dehydrogenase/fumarate reductase flavoprotein subunit
MSSRLTEIESDVVVVGFGAAGMAAAITAHDEGCDVVILEKLPAESAGGNSRVSGNVWFNPLDSEAAKTYLRALSGDYPVAEAIIEVWASEVSTTTEWVEARLAEVGESVQRDDRDPYQGPLYANLTTYAESQRARVGEKLAEPAHEFPDLAGHECDDGFHHLGPQTGYSRLWNLLVAAIQSRGIAIHYGTRATALCREAPGGVTGVIADTPDGAMTFHARGGTILATGGFENNQDMIRTYLRIPGALPWGSPENTGDGILLAQSVGADLVNMHNFAGVMGLAVHELGRGMAGVPKDTSFILVGPDGRRFMNESINDRHGKARLRGEYVLHPSQRMFTIFDERTRLAGPIVVPFERHGSGWAKTIDRFVWSPDNSAEVARGWIRRGDTPRDLAQQLGLEADELEETVTTFNRSVSSGVDLDFGRPLSGVGPLEPPFYGYPWGPVVMYTCGGPRKDEAARVIDTQGRPVPRLYCAGEISATNSWGMSGGQMISDALAFGRVAGRSAAQNLGGTQ